MLLLSSLRRSNPIHFGSALVKTLSPSDSVPEFQRTYGRLSVRFKRSIFTWQTTQIIGIVLLPKTMNYLAQLWLFCVVHFTCIVMMPNLWVYVTPITMHWEYYDTLERFLNHFFIFTLAVIQRSLSPRHSLWSESFFFFYVSLIYGPIHYRPPPETKVDFKLQFWKILLPNTVIIFDVLVDHSFD